MTEAIFVIRRKWFSVVLKIPYVKIQIFRDRSFTWFLNYLLAKFLEILTPGVRFSKDPKTLRARKVLGAVFGRDFRVAKSGSKHPNVTRDSRVCFFGNVPRRLREFVSSRKNANSQSIRLELVIVVMDVFNNFRMW